MKKLYLTLVIMGLSILLMAGNAQAIPVAETLGAYTISGLGDFGTQIGSTLIKQIASGGSGNINNLMASACYYDESDGVYTYLYQVYANGAATTTRFTIEPFIGLTNKTAGSPGTTARMGYVSSSSYSLLPSTYGGWTIETPSILPNAGDFDTATDTAGFSFNTPSTYIVPDSTTHILVVASTYPPGLINGNMIDGGVATDDVYGPIPEPASVALLGLGLIGLAGGVIRRRFRA